MTAGEIRDLLRFHQAVMDRRLLGPDLTAELLSPKARHSARGAGSHLMGFGFEFETDADGVVRFYWKEGVNVGASGILTHYPAQNVTVVVLAAGEDAAWEPIRCIDEAVSPPGEPTSADLTWPGVTWREQTSGSGGANT